MTGVKALIVACGIVRRVASLEAVVRVESGGNPLALAVNGAVELVRPPRDLADAAAMARWLAAHGYSFDAGLGQVNSANLARLGLDTTSVFEPCANLRAASRVLEECHARALRRWADDERALAAALSCYNTGHLTRGFTNGYVAAVRAAARARAPQRPASGPAPAGQGTPRDAPRAVTLAPGALARAERAGDVQPRDEAFATSLPDAFAERMREEQE